MLELLEQLIKENEEEFEDVFEPVSDEELNKRLAVAPYDSWSLHISNGTIIFKNWHRITRTELWFEESPGGPYPIFESVLIWFMSFESGSKKESWPLGKNKALTLLTNALWDIAARDGKFTKHNQ
jgi:hypothetical protein